MTLQSGERLGPYEIIDLLGRGGMGEVWKARDPRLDRLVAIKILPAPLTADGQARERLRREALAVAALDHPFICKAFELGEEQGRVFMVMELVAGETLHSALIGRRMDVPQILRIASQMADALLEAHGRMFVHRDLKPANIMLTTQGHVKIMDFGLARRFSPLPSDMMETAVMNTLTTPGSVVGTPEYMSPEQLKGQDLDSRSDLFSFGVILAEMLSGVHPFRKSNPVESLAAVLREPPDFGTSVPRSAVAERLVLIIRRLLAKSPDDRFASIAEVRQELIRMSTAPESILARDEETASESAGEIPLVGRDKELKQLREIMRRAVAGQGSVVLIAGEPGIGKTCLTSALLAEARAAGAYTLTGHCYESEGTPPYGPFIETLEHSSRNTPRKSFRHALGDDAPEVARIMPELRRLFDDIPPALELPPEQQRRFLFNAYRDFIDRSSRLTPLVAVFEDLHWADEPTLLLLQHLAQTVTQMPVMVLATYRDLEVEPGRPLARTLEFLLRLQATARIQLRRLPRDVVERMLALLSGQEPPDRLVQAVFDETEGNPFFVEEVFRHLQEEGKLFDETGKFRKGLRVTELEVPDGVRLVLSRRLQRLSDGARRILTCAAVIGRLFPLELLEDLERSQPGAAPDAALDALDEAEAARLVEHVRVGHHVRYRFTHELIRQTLAETLSLPRRKRLHAKIGAALERVYRDSPAHHRETADVTALAHHFFQAGAAGDPEKALLFLCEAAALASAATAYEDALEDIERAFTLLGGERSKRVAALHTRRAAVLQSLSRSPEAIEEYERALALFDELGEHFAFVETAGALGGIYIWTASRLTDLSALTERAAVHARQGPPAAGFIVLAMQVLSASELGETDRACELLSVLDAIPWDGLPPQAVAIAAGCKLGCMFHCGRMAECEAVARMATAVVEQTGDLWMRSTIHYALYTPAMQTGRLGEAEELILDAVARAGKVGHDDARFMALWSLASLRLIRGDLAAAGKIGREALAFGESFNAGWMLSGEISLGNVLLHCDNIDEAVPVLCKAAAAARTFYGGSAEGLLALAMTAGGVEGADEAIEAARRLLPRPGTRRSMGAWNAVLSLLPALCLAGRREEAAELAGDAEAIAAEWTASCLGFPARTAAALGAASRGDWALAEIYHRQAIQQMETAGYVGLLPIARYWFADTLLERARPEDAATAGELLQQAIAESARSGMALYRRLAHTKLVEVGEGQLYVSRTAGEV